MSMNPTRDLPASRRRCPRQFGDYSTAYLVWQRGRNVAYEYTNKGYWRRIGTDTWFSPETPRPKN